MQERPQVNQIPLIFRIIMTIFSALVLAGVPTLIVVAVSGIKGVPGFLVGFVLLVAYMVLFIFIGKLLGLWTRGGFSDLGPVRPLGPSIGIAIALSVAARIWIVIVTLLLQAGQTANDAGIEDIAQSSSVFLLAIAVIFVAPVVEEVIFRGMIFRFFFRDKPIFAMLISALLFALVHGPTDLASFLMYGGLGLTFSFTYYTTQRLEMSILAHFFNNFLPGIMLVLLQLYPHLLNV